MADPEKAVLDNIPGEFFVDTTCINCDTCRQLAPATFMDQGEFSCVFNQPESDDQRREATRALLACPTGSIGTRGENHSKKVLADFPLPLTKEVYYCGFNSPKSYGANSYLVTHPDGNWLVDSPKFVPRLVEAIEKVGGLKYIFLTHQDDVAEADKFATKFGAKRIIHRLDFGALPNAEIIIDGTEEQELEPGFLLIPVPGHTRGHVVLLHDNVLFTGDHLAYDPKSKRLKAFRGACWYSWTEQTKSMARLLNHKFEWVLAGHGDRVHMDANIMHEKLESLVKWMRETR